MKAFARIFIFALLLTPAVIAQAQTNVVLSWPQWAGSYVLESTESLAPPSWVAAPGVAGDGSLKDLMDTNAVAAQKFYRVSIQ